MFNNHVRLLLGGITDSTSTHIFDVNTETWSNGPALSTGRSCSQAGLVTFGNGTRMAVVAGGQNTKTTEFLSLDENSWHYGPELPYDIVNGASIQLDETFLIVGGNNGSLMHFK